MRHTLADTVRWLLLILIALVGYVYIVLGPGGIP